MSEPVENESKEIDQSAPQEPNKDDGKAKERERVLSLLEITDDLKELKKFIETDIDPAKAAMQVLKQIRNEKKRMQDSEFPSAFVSGSGVSKAQETIAFSKKMGVLR